jgi:flagellar hook-length control protein FliK
MNMSISSGTTASVVTTSTSGATGAVQGSSGGFAGALSGALVQTVGANQAGSATAGLVLPVGLVGLLGQLGLDSAEGQSEDLLAMIAKLVEQLDQLDNSDTIPKEVEEQLAELLTAFQGLLQQLEQSKPVVTVEQGETSEVLFSNQGVNSGSLKSVTQTLRETLLQLTTMLTNGQEITQAASGFVNQLKDLLDKLGSQPTVTAANQAMANQSDQAATTKATSAAPDQGATVSKDGVNQAAAVIAEVRRPVQTIRDPIWRLNLVADAENTSSEAKPAIVPTVVTAEEVTDSDSQPAWTMLRNDAMTTSDSNLVKAPVPAHVPVQQFAQQMEKLLVKQFQLTQGNGTTEAKITLNPEHLGQVDIRIIMQNGLVTAQFMTENGMARDLLDTQMSQLRLALQGQGLQVDRLEVVQQSSGASNASFLQQDHRQSNSGNNGHGSNGRGKDGLYEDPALFAAELERNSSLKEFGYGSSINVTA